MNNNQQHNLPNDILMNGGSQLLTPEQTELSWTTNNVFTFTKNNPYTQTTNPLQKIKPIIESGNLLNLVYVIEAHLQKQPNDAKGWRALGFIYQELDQDHQSVECFIQSVKHNSLDRQSLLQLGVSSLNIFDNVESLKYIGNCCSVKIHYS